MHRSVALVVLALAGCSCGARSDPASGGTGVAPEGEPTPEGAEATAGSYEVHEWGLVRAGIGDVLIVGAVGPPRRTEIMAVDKPVLYFHAAEALLVRRVDVTARGGAIVEAWPSPPRTGDASRLGWRDVRIDPSGACEPTPLPGLGDTACTSLPAGELCEVASLATVRVADAACVRTAEGQDRMLFYRARTRAFNAPLRFTARSGALADVEVTHGGTAPLPGWLVRIHDDGFQVRALAVRPPAPGEKITVGADFAAAVVQGTDRRGGADDMPARPGSAEPGMRAVRETLRELGMTDGETDAFLRAWSSPIFGLAPTTAGDGEDATPVDRLGASDETVADIVPAPRESFLYFLAEDDCDRIAHLEMDPPPRAVRRAFAVWSAVTP